MIEKILQEKNIYPGKIVRLKELSVELPDGREVVREVVDHDPAVVIIPFKAPDTVYLIKQFRVAVNTILLEVPAGLINHDEDPNCAALRELREETGFTASNLHYSGQSFPAPGFCNEKLSFYIATGLTLGKTEFDRDEFIETEELTLPQLKEKIDSGEIQDTKTILSYFYLQDALQKGAVS
jgi:ADP-ribose pyrophosphatase